MTDNNINYLAKLLELKDNMPFCTYKEEARWLLENGVKIPVKCKDCKYLRESEITNRMFCIYHGDSYEFETQPNDYCSNGVCIVKEA